MRKSWLKWGLLVAGSTVAALQLGACVSEYLLMEVILSVVN